MLLSRIVLGFLLWLAFAGRPAGKGSLHSGEEPVAPPAVSAADILNAASLQPALAPSTWVTVSGTNLASSTRPWRELDFVEKRLPTELDGVSVLVNGRSGYLGYVSPTKLYLLLPDDETLGAVELQVLSPQGASEPVSVTTTRIAPALFTRNIGEQNYVAAFHADGTRVGQTGLFENVTARPARPGETVQVYGTGFGATVPPHPASDVVESSLPLAASVSARVGDTAADVSDARLVTSGTYRLSLVVPDVPDGDQPVIAEVEGFRTQQNALITIQRVAAAVSAIRPIIVDHASTDLARIPPAWIERARKTLSLYYGHTSYGSQITNGLQRLQSQYGSNYNVAIGPQLAVDSGPLRLLTATTYDWNPDFYPTVARIVKANPAINVVMYTWCGQAATARWREILNEYLDNMQSLEKQYPNVTFVYTTGNAQEKDCPGCVRHQFNQQLRQFVKDNKKVLFDFGDLDVWYKSDVRTYSTPSWCSNYGCTPASPIPFEHPQWGGGDYNNPCGHTTYESCDNKAKAMWWLLARIAGWDGTPAEGAGPSAHFDPPASACASR